MFCLERRKEVAAFSWSVWLMAQTCQQVGAREVFLPCTHVYECVDFVALMVSSTWARWFRFFDLVVVGQVGRNINPRYPSRCRLGS